MFQFIAVKAVEDIRRFIWRGKWREYENMVVIPKCSEFDRKWIMGTVAIDREQMEALSVSTTCGSTERPTCFDNSVAKTFERMSSGGNEEQKKEKTKK